jgi:hypothetical protein
VQTLVTNFVPCPPIGQKIDDRRIVHCSHRSYEAARNEQDIQICWTLLEGRRRRDRNPDVRLDRRSILGDEMNLGTHQVEHSLRAYKIQLDHSSRVVRRWRALWLDIHDSRSSINGNHRDRMTGFAARRAPAGSCWRVKVAYEPALGMLGLCFRATAPIALPGWILLSITSFPLSRSFHGGAGRWRDPP